MQSIKFDFLKTMGAFDCSQLLDWIWFFVWFENKDNKVLIAPRAVQFWSEINLVKINRASASRSCDFVITRLISDQIALHSVQLPLYINSMKPLL